MGIVSSRTNFRSAKHLRSHETLDSLPDVWCCSLGRVGCQGKVWVRVGSTGASRGGVVWARVAGQLNDISGRLVNVAGDGNGVRESSLGRIVNEEHVADLDVALARRSK